LVPLPQEERNRPSETGLQARAIVGGFLHRPADAERPGRTLVPELRHSTRTMFFAPRIRLAWAQKSNASRWTRERPVCRSPRQENIKFIDGCRAPGELLMSGET